MGKKKTTQQYELDATQAIKAIKDVAKAYDTHNEKVKLANSRLASLGAWSQKAEDKLVKMRDAASEAARRVNTYARRVDNLSTKTADATAAMGSFNTMLIHQRDAQRDVLNANKRLVTSYDRIEERLNKMEVAGQKFQVALNQNRSELRKSTRNIESFGKQLMKTTKELHKLKVVAESAGKELRTMREASNRVVPSLRAMVRISAAITLHRVYIQIAQAMRESITEAKIFSLKIAEIQTISQDVTVTNHQWEESLKRLSVAFGVDVLEQAEGLYQAISNQTVKGADATSFLSQELKLAAITVTSLGTAVSATTAVLNGYQMESTNTAAVNAILFRTVELGRLRLDDIANSIGRVTILSNQLGISFREQQAAIAILTRQGVSAEEAMTLLRNIQLKLVKPTERLKEIYSEWGVTSGEAAIRTFGFVEVLRRFAQEAQKTGDTSQGIAEIFNQIRAVVGASGLIGAFEDFEQTLSDFGDSGENAMKAFDLAMESTSKRADKLTQEMRLYFLDNFGTPVLEKFVELGESSGDLTSTVDAVVRTAVQGAIVFVTYQAAMAGATAATAAFNAVTQAMQINAMTGSIQGFNGALGNGITKTQMFSGIVAGVAVYLYEWSAANDRLEQSMERVVRQQVRIGQGIETRNIEFSALKIEEASFKMNQALAAQLKNLSAYEAFNRASLNRITDDWEKSFKRIGDAVKLRTADMVKDAKGSLAALKEELKAATAEVESRTKARRDLARELEKGKFDADVKGRTGSDLDTKLMERRNKLRIEATKAARAGDQERSDYLFQQAEALHARVLEHRKTESEEAVRSLEKLMKQRNKLELDMRTGKGKRGDAAELAKITREMAKLKAAEAVAAKDLKFLEDQRLEALRERVKLEDEMLKKAEAREHKAALEAVAREKALKGLEKQLALLDTFDHTQVGAKDKFGKLLNNVDDLSAKAGIGGADRMNLLREARKQQRLLEVAEEKKIEAERLKAIQKNVQDITDAVRKGEKAKQDALGRTSQEYEKFGTVLREQVTAIDEFLKTLDAGDNRQKNMKSAQADLDATRDNLSKIKILMQEINKRRGGKGAIFIDPEPIRLVDERIKTLRTQLMQLDPLLQRNAPYLFGLIDRKKAVGALRDGVNLKIGDDTDAVRFEKIQEQLEKTTKAFKDLEEAEKVQGTSLQRQKMMSDLLSELEKKHPKVADAAKKSAEDQTNSIENLNQKLRETLRLLEQSGKNIPALEAQQKKALGRNFGGNGMDNIPALINPNEYVVNARASERIRPMLQRANDATSSNSSNGGSVNFGDIYLQVPEGTSADQGMDIIHQLKRHARIHS